MQLSVVLDSLLELPPLLEIVLELTERSVDLAPDESSERLGQQPAQPASQTHGDHLAASGRRRGAPRGISTNIPREVPSRV
jgi:hypothetical protein